MTTRTERESESQQLSPGQPAALAEAVPGRAIPEHGNIHPSGDDGAQGSLEQTTLHRGQVYEAVVDTVHPDAALVHLPRSQRQGFAPARDLRQLDAKFRGTLEEGDHVPVRVLKDPGSPGDFVVSLDQTTTGKTKSPEEDWARAEELMTSGEEFEAKVTGFNHGGVVVAFGQLEGFVPNSHLERTGSRDRQAKARLVGQSISLAVLEVDRSNRRLVLSQRAVGDSDKEQILSQLEKGQVHTGVVRNLVNFGAFVDLGGVDGLIHISELDWSHVNHPSDVLSVGDEVEVYVLDVDRERSRISLSRKYLLPRPWDKAPATPQGTEPSEAMVADELLQHRRSW